MKITGAGSQMENNPAYFSELSCMAKNHESKTIKQIDKDIIRTFPKDKDLDKEGLRKVLVTYSLRNPNVGYCQGINFIVASLLKIGFNHDETFWLFVQIIEQYVPTGYYSSMSGVILDQKVFDHLLRLKQPKLMKLMERLEMDSTLFTIQWFICVFSFSFPLETVMFFWDNIFVKGFPILFCIGLSIASIIKKQLFNQTDFIEILSIIDRACESMTDIQKLKKSMQKKSARVPFGFIYRLRSVYETEVLSGFNQRFSSILPKDYLYRTLSSVCIDENECKQKILETCNFFTFSLKTISQIDDYLENYKYPKEYLATKSEDWLILGKKNHKCRFEETDSGDEAEDPVDTLRKTIMMVSTQKSFMYVSSFVNIQDFEN